MDSTRESAIYEAAQIAKTLFWVNLAPAAVAGATFIFFLFNMLLHADYEIIGLLISLIIGIFAEFIYYRQFTDADYTEKTFGWVYSIVVNVLFIVFQVIISINFPSALILIIIYPAIFLIQSYRGLMIIRKNKE